MTKEELIEALNSLNKLGDPEVWHGKADDLIIDFINDKEKKLIIK